MHNINLSLFYFFNGAARVYGTLDVLMLFITTYVTIAIAVAVSFWVLFYTPLYAPSIKGKLHAIRHAVEYAFVIVGTYVLVQCIKLFVMAPRPFATLSDMHSLSPTEGGYSFPSMHAAMMVAIATLIYLHHKRLGVLLYAFAVVVSLSRVYIGVHYPKDVLIGGLLGFAISALLHIAFCNMHTEIVNDIAPEPKKG